MSHSCTQSEITSTIYDENGKRQTLDALRNSKDHERWERALHKEWGRLAQVNIHQVLPTDTIEFIKYTDIPSNSVITYALFACDHRALKSEPW